MRLLLVLTVCAALLVPVAAHAEDVGVYAGPTQHNHPGAQPKTDGVLNGLPRPVFLSWAISTNTLFTAFDAYTLLRGGKSSRTMDALEFIATTPIFFFGVASLRRAPNDRVLTALTAWSGVLMVKGFVQVLRYGNRSSGEISPADRAIGAGISPTLLTDAEGENLLPGAVVHGSF